MPNLPRTSTRLLRQVAGKVHATENDHENRPAAGENAKTGGKAISRTGSSRNAAKTSVNGSKNDREDAEDQEAVDYDPISSDDEPQAAVFRQPPAVPDSPDTSIASTKFRIPAAQSRISGSDDNVADDRDIDDFLFGSQPTPKRRRVETPGSAEHHLKSSSAPSQNRQKIFAPPRRKPVKYGKALSSSMEPRSSNPGSVFRVAADVKEVEPEKVHFRVAAGGDLPDPTTLSDTTIASSGLASSSVTDLTHAVDGDQTECNICGSRVSRDSLDDFVRTYLRHEIKLMTYRWQQRFCKQHKRHEAEHMYKTRGYPIIDWPALESRMQAHRSYLLAILEGSIKSARRDELVSTIKNARSIEAALDNNTSSKRTAVGYYGPRGEKAMTEHILRHYADELREHAVSDKLVAVSSAAGGVSGFVQSVLVPELAEMLVAEDLRNAARQHAKGAGDEKGKRIGFGEQGKTAAQVMDESAELGELVHPDAEEEGQRLYDGRIEDP